MIDLRKGDALDLIMAFDERPDLVVTDPPYAFGGTGDEHELSATVAVVLREAAARLAKGRWMVVMCAASYRSTQYMIDAVRGHVEPVRFATWTKPQCRTKTRTAGWQWQSVNVIAFRKGKAIDKTPCDMADHISAPPVMNGRRAELPPEVAHWMAAPYAVAGGVALDPFAGSGVILRAAAACDMRAIGFERSPADPGSLFE